MAPNSPLASRLRPNKNNVQQNSPASAVPVNEKILKTIKHEIQKRSSEIISQINAQMHDMNKIINEKLESFINETNIRLNEVNSAMSTLSARVDQLEGSLIAYNQLKAEVSVLRNKTDYLERKNISADAVLLGVPKRDGEDLTKLYHQLCRSINLNPAPMPRQIFRARPRGTSQDSAIIIKFQSPSDKIGVLKSTSHHCKQFKKPLCLKDIGFETVNRIYLNESLTTHNHILHRKALQLKLCKRLTSVFTRGGRVYAKTTSDSGAFMVDSCECLDKITTDVHRSAGTS